MTMVFTRISMGMEPQVWLTFKHYSESGMMNKCCITNQNLISTTMDRLTLLMSKHYSADFSDAPA